MRYNHCGVIVRHTLRAPSGAPPGNKGQIPGKAFGKKKCAHTRPRAGTESTTRLFALESVRVGVVGNISACHADARGSIPRRGDALFWPIFCPCSSVPRLRTFPVYASIAQLAEHLLRKEKVTSSILVGGWVCMV